MSQRSEDIKPSIYGKRKLTSIPAPLEPDSDPEFNPGTFIYEKPTKRGKRKTTAGRDASPSSPRKRRSDVLGIESISRRNRRPMDPEASRQHNPLKEFFDDDLGLQSASDEDDENPEDGDSAEEHESEPEQPMTLRTMAAFMKASKESTPVAKALADDDSATEPESEPDIAHVPTKRKSPASEQDFPASKRIKAPSPDDDSETEPESDAESQIVSRASKQLPLITSNFPEDDSETEPEGDEDETENSIFNPRPGFPLAPGQTPLGPLILNKREGIVVPGSINTYLREYQREGVMFFWKLYNKGHGGLLGDDMGLGKTIQVISFLSAIMKKYGDERDIDRRRNHVSNLQDGPEWSKRRILPRPNKTWPTCLIIGPTSVVPNWQREFETWGYFEVGSYTGSKKEREGVLTDFKMGRLDVVLTTFDVARRDIALLDDLAWSAVFIDEAHRVKNPKSKITIAFNQFTCLRRFGLTGTTIQNSYMEAWTILDWTNPGRLGTSKQWKGYVVKPLTIGQSASATEEERTKALTVAIIVRDKVLPRFFKRRTKDIIKHQLPTKTDEVVFCPLTPIQIAVYKRILNMHPVQNLVKKDERCDCGSEDKRKDCCHPMEKGGVLKYMSILIKISNHLALILPAPNDSPEQTVRNRELAEVAFPGQPMPKYGTAMLLPQYCGKWVVLDTLLREWRKDCTNKVLIFTKSVKLIDMLEFHLNTNSYGFLKLDGSTKQNDRMPMIDRFHRDPDIFIFLISTLAGGTGLNLTGANKVVIFDPNWNPAHDLQAMDRAYRFGQTRDVFVYRLLGAGSIEELIYARQLYKQQQMAIGYQASVQTRYFSGVQGDTSRQGELFGIKNIFKLHEDTLATKMAIERATIMELDWALANLNSKAKKPAKSKAEDWVHEADSKSGKEEADLRGLSALLFDDEPPEVAGDNDIHKTLSAIGVKYSHRNDDVLLPSRIEEERSRTALKDAKRRRAAANERRQSSPQKTPEPQWPPKRKHHKPPLSPRSKLASRQMALIELSMINSPADLPVFAQSFARKSSEEQHEILARLDAH